MRIGWRIDGQQMSNALRLIHSKFCVEALRVEDGIRLIGAGAESQKGFGHSGYTIYG